jgi:hypothetical protein
MPTGVDNGDTAWLMVSTAMVLLMTPGLAFFYGGMVRTSHVLTMLRMSFACLAIVTVIWFVFGYSLAFSGDVGGLGKARDRKLSLEDMQGGTFTITNLGGIGGSFFTPIVNAPEVAILGVARGQMEPVYLNGQFEPRLMLPLALSYDHRLIDGADGARFLRALVEHLEQPFLTALQGW